MERSGRLIVTEALVALIGTRQTANLLSLPDHEALRAPAVRLREVPAVTGQHRAPRDAWVLGCALLIAACGIVGLALIGWAA